MNSTKYHLFQGIGFVLSSFCTCRAGGRGPGVHLCWDEAEGSASRLKNKKQANSVDHESADYDYVQDGNNMTMWLAPFPWAEFVAKS